MYARFEVFVQKWRIDINPMNRFKIVAIKIHFVWNFLKFSEILPLWLAILFINLKAAVKDTKQIITFFSNIWLKMTKIFMFKAVEQ